MSEFLERLKHGMQEAQQKFTAAQQRMNAFNVEFQAAAQEFQAWQTLVRLETIKEQQAAGIAPTQQLDTLTSAISHQSNGTKSESNKTEAVRELLRQHPAGMTPTEIWKQLETLLSNRAYLYSVLKRLKDRGDARERRGKYFLNPKIEGQEDAIVP